MSDLYYHDFVSHIMEVLKDNFGTTIRGFYEGDPVVFGESSLPAICVLKDTSKVMYGPTGFDEIDSSYTLKIVLDKRTDYGASPTVDLTDKKLRKMAEGRDDTTGLFLPESVIGILRTYISLNDNINLNPVLDSNLDVKYWLVPRPSVADEEMITMEAHITMNVRELVQIPVRY